jgi:hypothetical protein
MNSKIWQVGYFDPSAAASAYRMFQEVSLSDFLLRGKFLRLLLHIGIILPRAGRVRMALRRISSI